MTPTLEAFSENGVLWQTLSRPMGRLYQVTHEVAYLRTAFVNVFFLGRPGAGDREWVLVDTGIPGSANRIRAAAARRFGPLSRPAAIILTHGHFDHVGAVRELAEEWDVVVYAHHAELPYLTGRSAYPPPDPTVGGGAMAAMSFLYPKAPIDLGNRVAPLPEDGTVPHAARWRWIYTPGHAPGHVSLFRDDDAALIAGDAFVTTRQESLLSVMEQRAEVNGPPMYFTPDWSRAATSVRALAELRPRVAATGHGPPLHGDRMLQELERLAQDFERRAMPRSGRYVGRPAVMDENGVLWVPPRTLESKLMIAAASVAVGALLIRGLNRRRR
jgi:glyoxylase-like metal-dependent hydrolase (beta-lactamase superfamily II)